MTTETQTPADALAELRAWLAEDPTAVSEICDDAVRALRGLRRELNRPLVAADRAAFRWSWGGDPDGGREEYYVLTARTTGMRVCVDLDGAAVCCRWL